MSSVPRTFPVFFVAVAAREAEVASLRAGMKMIWFCHKSLYSVTCLPEPNHVKLRSISGEQAFFE